MSAKVRVTAELERLLDSAARATGKSRSEIIREAISLYCELLLNKDRLSKYDMLAQGKFEPLNSGLHDLSVSPKRLKLVMSERANRHSS